jgi:hypothetical protein
MCLVGTVFSGLSALVIDDVRDAGKVICVVARTRDQAVACPGCGTLTARVHGYHERTAADVPVDGRRVLVRVRARRMRCPVLGCPRQTFREQVPGVLDRYQRRTCQLNGQVRAVVRELAGRAGARVLAALGTAEVVRRALPAAVQVSDRWHLWHGLAEAAGKEVAAHSTCWAQARPPQAGPRAQTTTERWQQVHDLRGQGVGLLECARRLNLSLNTVKRYARATRPERLQRAPQYRATLVDPYRDHLRKRRAEEPAVPVQQLLREIRELGCTGSSNLLVRYLTQGRAEADRPHLSPRRATRLLLTRPTALTDGQTTRLAALSAACPEMTALAGLVRSFAGLLAPDPGNDHLLQQWITTARDAGLPHLHAFCNGLDLDIQAATAALTLPHHNGRTEGVNTKTKMIKRQMYGRAGFTLLRHRILLG